MTTFRFKFPSQKIAHEVGVKLGFLVEHKNEEGEPFVTAVTGYAWSEGIAVSEPTGKMVSTEFGEYPERVLVPGYHCNVLVPKSTAEKQTDAELFAELYGANEYVVFPKHPQQVFL